MVMAVPPAVEVELLAPVSREVRPRGLRPTFVLKDRPGRIGTVEVSDSARTDATGIFVTSVWTAGYESSGTRTKIRPLPSPDGFWNRPGTYYWHLSRVVCPSTGPRPHTCAQKAITRTRSFRIS